MKLFSRRNVDITSGNLFYGILMFTLPVILTNILQTLYNAADMIIVGRYAGDICLAAVGATGSVTNLIVGLFVGMGAGVSAIVSRYIGADDFEKTSKAVHTTVAMSLIFGFAIGIFGILSARSIMEKMGTPSDVIDQLDYDDQKDLIQSIGLSLEVDLPDVDKYELKAICCQALGIIIVH